MGNKKKITDEQLQEIQKFLDNQKEVCNYDDHIIAINRQILEESDTPIFDYQRQCIKLTREIDSLRSSYVDLQETVKDCVFQLHNKLWKLKPEVAQLVITLTEKSQLDNTDNNNND